MWTFLIIIVVTVYIGGIYVYVSSETMQNFKFHDGGFLNIGYTTHDNREVTSADIRWGLLWPILGIVAFVKSIIFIINDDIIHYIGLLFNLKYRNTKIYRSIGRLIAY